MEVEVSSCRASLPALTSLFFFTGAFLPALHLYPRSSNAEQRSSSGLPSSASPPSSAITTPSPNVVMAQLQKPGTGEGTWTDRLIHPMALVCRVLVAADGLQILPTNYRDQLRRPLQSEGV